MSFRENLRIAISSILANRIRSFLTILGIIIGISSVITIVSLGQGGKNSITGEFEKIGASTISVKVNSQRADTSDYITDSDIKNISEKVPTVKYISPMVQKRGIINSYKGRKNAFITGGNEETLYIQNYEILYGRFFSRKESLEGKAVVVLDQLSAKSIFGYEDVVGKKINIGSKLSPKKASIIGITKNQVGIFPTGDLDNMPAFAVVPMNFINQLFPEDNLIDMVVVTATSRLEGETAGKGAINILEKRHNNKGRRIYKADSILKQLDQVNKVIGIFTAFISAVAAISLIVGGIGIMNIMLVSVSERTREIGIRKAIGATTNNILAQFLTESVILSLLGGIIGMLLGILSAFLIGNFVNVTPVLSIKVIISVIVFSSLVGIFFGIYPAKKASALNPIDALRYE